MKVHVAALGCKLNQSEAESWARELAAAGCRVVTDPAEAELSIVNTCTVTHVAARKSRQLTRHCAAANPGAHVVVTGCYAEISPAEAAQLPGVTLVLGTAHKEHLVEAVAARFGISLRSPESEARLLPSLHTRAFVKIQDGCDNACTYCIVRVARGRQRSRPLREVLDEIVARESEGYQEMVLTGVHIGAYGRERRETLADLVAAILSSSGFPRLRLSSIEPWDLTLDWLRLWEDRRLCRHLHLPLQSGCDATLRRMNRRYTTAQYSALLSTARAAIPGVSVTTDVIVGFPGEDEAEFAESARFIAGLDLARIHVFPFSQRPGTAAAALPGQVPPQAKQERGERIRAIAAQSAAAFHRGFLGRTMDVLWESREGAHWSGLTDNYIRVQAASCENLNNRIAPARLFALTEGGMLGELSPRATP